MTDPRTTPPPAAPDRHVPVLRERVVELLAPALTDPGNIAVDMTLGLGGHTLALLQACPNAQVIGIDRDPQALHLATERLAPYADRFRAVPARYDELPTVLADLGVREVHAILFDLGVSSLQLDEPERGFAYRLDAPLDMRMDGTGSGPRAADVLNDYPVAELERILREYGEERYARRIARAIDRARAEAPLETSARLVDLIRAAVPAASQRTGGHPAKRTFQALRIEVNGELAALEAALPVAIDALSLSGRVVVVSYHSLEDRMAKRALGAGARSSTPAGLPVELPGHEPYVRLLTRGAEEPSPEEIAINPRAASARLRAAIRTRVTKGPRP
ncbi:MAG: 16S rRNA (cytosine(1402)-N(4))-methyltransferase RsmH [Austwickia sp.]|nr:16S rRNA (cytosine(1402)-N(4))-methyltransferase RsmH [Austwickia sp.]MBK8435743.1 16S rRNA (cytosine(1402)-N(4))-methyltransferase RsmH [Austwickia sp.]MBK9100696.1 16S rRNA (cytosine(1402)-N(4))-methyltransferase RsmH [Austwickia sp.]